MTPDCYLPALSGAPATPEVVPIHPLDCPKDGLDDAALVVLVHEPGQLVPVRPGHIAPSLAAPVLAGGAGFGPDARCHALGSYRVANLPCQVGRIQAEETSAPSSILPSIGHIPATSEAYPSVTR